MSYHLQKEHLATEVQLFDQPFSNLISFTCIECTTGYQPSKVLLTIKMKPQGDAQFTSVRPYIHNNLL